MPKMTPVAIRIHREIKGEVKSIKLTPSATEKYFISLLCEEGTKASEKVKDIIRITGLERGAISGRH